MAAPTPPLAVRTHKAQRQVLEDLEGLNAKDVRKLGKAWSEDDLSATGSGLIALYAKIDESRTDVLRALAKVVVALRTRYRTPQGDTDWRGQSWEYRQAISEMYGNAGVPPDSESNIQAALRYHVGNLVREVAPPVQLEAVGLLPTSPKDRMDTARRTLRALADAETLHGEGRARRSQAESLSQAVTATYSLVDSLEHSTGWPALSLRVLEQYEDRLDEMTEKLEAAKRLVVEAISTKLEESSTLK